MYDGDRRICTQGRWTRLAGDTIAWAAGGSYRLVLRSHELVFYAPGPKLEDGQRIATASTRYVEPAEAYQRVDSAAANTLRAACREQDVP